VTGSTNQIELNKTQFSDVRVPTFSEADTKKVINIINDINQVVIGAKRKVAEISSLKNSLQLKYWC
jgi:hypothetical protein